MKQGSISHLLLIGFGSLLLSLNLTQASCVSMQMQHQYPYSPSLTIETSQAPDEGMLPTGYNHSIICISNISEKFYGNPYYGQPYWMQIFFNDAYVRSCGGRSSDSEDSKICTYPIVNSVEADSGNYTCVARNQLSCIIGTLPVKFEKSTLPTVTLNPPQDFNVSYGSTVNFTCEARGSPKPKITWYKDGRPLFGRNIQNVQGISHLTLESVTSYDGGEYWCEAKNSEGGRTSINTTIKVLSMPVILVHPSNVSLNLEETNIKVIFFCKVIGFPRPSITWLKNDSTLTGGMVVQNGSSSFLVLQSVTKEETFARYKCIAKNSLGEVSSKEGVLVVREQIQHSGITKGQRLFYFQPRSIKAITGDHVVFVCAVEGSPVPQIVWLKDGSANVDGNIDYYSGEQSATSVLKIYPVSESHVGRYSCEATRFAGNAISQEAVLVITDEESSHSTLCISKAVWVPVATGAFVLLLIIISIFFVHVRNKNAKFNIAKKMREDNQFPHLHTQDDMISQQRGNSKAPRYQMTNLAFTNL